MRPFPSGPVTAGALCAGLALSACGSSAPALDASAARMLQDQISAVGTDANRRDWTGATAALDALARSVGRQRALGHLSPQDSQALMTGVAQAQRQLQAQAQTAATHAPQTGTPAARTAAPTAAAPTTVVAPDKGAGAKHKDRAKGNAGGGDGGGFAGGGKGGGGDGGGGGGGD